MKAPPLGFTFDCTPLRVLDGDTVEVQTPHLKFPIKIRMKDCWCAESKINSQIKKRFGVDAAKLEKELGVSAKAVLTQLIGKAMTTGTIRAMIEIDPNKPLLDQLTFNRVPGTLWESANAKRSIAEIMWARCCADATKEAQERRWVKMYGKSGTK